MNNKNLSQSKSAIRVWFSRVAVFVVCVIVVAVVAVIYPFFVWFVTQFFGEFSNWEKYGQFGDSFGFLTAVFTAGAFYLLWKTYKTQTEELRAVRESMAKQKSAMDMQKFETTFFNILNLYSESIKNLYTYRGNEKIFGKDALANYSRSFISDVRAVIEGQGSDQEKLNRIYRNPSLSYLWRNYRIFVVLLDSCDRELSSDLQKYTYGEIACSGLSETEATAFSFICLHEDSVKQKKMIADYFFRKGLWVPARLPEIHKWLARVIESNVSEI